MEDLSYGHMVGSRSTFAMVQTSCRLIDVDLLVIELGPRLWCKPRIALKNNVYDVFNLPVFIAQSIVQPIGISLPKLGSEPRMSRLQCHNCDSDERLFDSSHTC
jgi:hypothetical protein